jgi:hypothetical protein
VTDATILTIDNDTMLASWVLSIRAWSIIEEGHLLGSIFYSDGVYEIIIFPFRLHFFPIVVVFSDMS